MEAIIFLIVILGGALAVIFATHLDKIDGRLDNIEEQLADTSIIVKIEGMREIIEYLKGEKSSKSSSEDIK